MKQFQYVITDPIGLHARAAGLLVKAAKTLDSTITIEKLGGGSAGASKLMALMALGVKNGDTVIVRIEGGDEGSNLATIEQFFQQNL
jgi:phosphocarrier protein HPr